MQKLSGMDSMFLSLESSTNLFQVGAVTVLDPSTAPADAPPPHEALRQVVETRLDRLPPLRKRLAEVPGGLDHPRWVDDSPDVSRHVKRAALPSPGGECELSQFTADVLSHPLDRERPLWEIHVVEGLEGGLVAGVAKIHHSLIDGVSGTEVTGELMDLEPRLPGPGLAAGPAARGDAELVTGTEPPPGALSLLRGVIPGAARRVFPALRTMANLSTAGVRVRSRNRHLAVPPPSPFQCPRTSLTARLGAQRVVGLAHVDRSEVDNVRNATGATVNEVVLALTGSVLRAYLAEKGELPSEPLVAFVPVSVRTASDTLLTGVNRLSGMLVSLATDISDPLVRLITVSESSRSAKQQGGLLSPDLFSGFAELAVPALLRPVGRMARATGLTTRRPPFNTVVSSFPGPKFPLYCAGAEMLAYHPFGPVIDGAALNVTAMSYRDQIGFGLLACRDAVQDMRDLARSVPEAMRELSKAVASSRNRSRLPSLPARSARVAKAEVQELQP